MSQPRRRAPVSPSTDRYVLYERAVQEPNDEIALLERMLKKTGRPPRRLREDFSGTALLAATWVLKGPDRTAVAVDLEPKVHAWARAHRLPDLGDAARRLRLVQADVRRGPRGPFDAILALNFSYMVFQARPDLRDYFRSVRRSLAPGGVFMLDLFGGWLAERGLADRRKVRGRATYFWEQESPDPITRRVRCAIHFERHDGRRMANAFRYDWRLWTLPELRDLLEETGFADIDVLWDPEPPGVDPRFVVRRSARNVGAWLAYLVARRPA